MCVVVVGLAMSALSAALTYGPGNAWTWLSMPVALGLGLGFVLALVLATLPARACVAFLLLTLVVQQSMLNQSPESVYFAQVLHTWEQGRFIRFNGLVQWFGWLWPYSVLLWALVRLSREQRGEI
jgi:hypothetical protein